MGVGFKAVALKVISRPQETSPSKTNLPTSKRGPLNMHGKLNMKRLHAAINDKMIGTLSRDWSIEKWLICAVLLTTQASTYPQKDLSVARLFWIRFGRYVIKELHSSNFQLCFCSATMDA